MKWATFLGQRAVVGEVGLEIETECAKGYTVPDSISKYWTIHNDGSLRHHGVEYVFAQPYNFNSEEYREAMKLFDQLTEEIDFLESTYTSVHVHLNMTNREVITVFNFMAVYLIVEELLNRYCGPDRNGNLFCLKTSNAEYNYIKIKEMVRAFDQGAHVASAFIKNGLSQNSLKYAALNLYTLRQFGSLEIRTHPGTVDVKIIHRWVSILHNLLLFATTFKNPVEVVNAFSASPITFVENAFKQHASFFTASQLELTSRCSDGLWYATTLAAQVDDWASFGKAKEPKTQTIKKTDVRLGNNQIHEFLVNQGATPVTVQDDV